MLKLQDYVDPSCGLCFDLSSCLFYNWFWKNCEQNCCRASDVQHTIAIIKPASDVQQVIVNLNPASNIQQAIANLKPTMLGCPACKHDKASPDGCST